MTEQTQDKLYAGKFKTVEDLEAGYKNSAAVFDENAKLKQQVEQLTTLPPDYMNPQDVELEETRVTEIKARAREVGMTQAQYEKFLRGDKARVDKRKEAVEAARKEVGEETINILTDYVAKHYPPELKDNMLNTFIGNKDARSAALKHREQLLSNRVPGVDKVAAGGYRVSREDIQKAYEKKEKNPGDMKARQHYINLLAAQDS